MLAVEWCLFVAAVGFEFVESLGRGGLSRPLLFQKLTQGFRRPDMATGAGVVLAIRLPATPELDSSAVASPALDQPAASGTGGGSRLHRDVSIPARP